MSLTCSRCWLNFKARCEIEFLLPNNKRAIARVQNLLLVVRVFLLLLLKHFNFFEALESKRDLLELHQLDSPEAPDTKRSDLLQVVELDVTELGFGCGHAGVANG